MNIFLRFFSTFFGANGSEVLRRVGIAALVVGLGIGIVVGIAGERAATEKLLAERELENRIISVPSEERAENKAAGVRERELVEVSERLRAAEKREVAIAEIERVAGIKKAAVVLAGAGLSGVIISFLLSYLKSSPTQRSRPDEDEIYTRLQLYVDKRLNNASGATPNAPSIEFSEADKAEILASIQAKLESNVLEGYAAKISELATYRVKKEAAAQLFEQVIDRLRAEVQDLAKRGNLNLILGILITIAGLVVLASAVFSSPNTHDPRELLVYFAPRITLTVLIEVFAYFFLQLYKQSLSEIKYFQNEITNIEARELALHIAAQSGDAGLQIKLVEELLRTERNFILGKDQTTVDLEKERLARSTYSDVANAIKELLKKKTDVQ